MTLFAEDAPTNTNAFALLLKNLLRHYTTMYHTGTWNPHLKMVLVGAVSNLVNIDMHQCHNSRTLAIRLVTGPG